MKIDPEHIAWNRAKKSSFLTVRRMELGEEDVQESEGGLEATLESDIEDAQLRSIARQDSALAVSPSIYNHSKAPKSTNSMKNMTKEKA